MKNEVFKLPKSLMRESLFSSFYSDNYARSM